ncbi:hypothetical protein BC567DRAFT_62189 [Phyllosticta citribraziliensis]
MRGRGCVPPTANSNRIPAAAPVNQVSLYFWLLSSFSLPCSQNPPLTTTLLTVPPQTKSDEHCVCPGGPLSTSSVPGHVELAQVVGAQPPPPKFPIAVAVKQIQLNKGDQVYFPLAARQLAIALSLPPSCSFAPKAPAQRARQNLPSPWDEPGPARLPRQPTDRRTATICASMF